jgi:large subunit ribosomal protein L29
MKAADLREKGVDDLHELQKSLAHDVFQNRLKNFTNRLDDTSVIQKTKRELARVTTLLRETELGIRKGGSAAPAKPAEKAAPAAGAAAASPEKPKKAAAKKAAPSTKSTKSAKKSEAKQS